MPKVNPIQPVELDRPDGFDGNYILVDKGHDLVIVTTWLDSDNLSQLVRLVISSIEVKKH